MIWLLAEAAAQQARKHDEQTYAASIKFPSDISTNSPKLVGLWICL